MNRAKLVVVWRITEACDLTCPFCAYSRSLPRPRATAHPAEVERLGALLGTYSAQTQRPILVSWLGGEPLLWKPFFKVSQRFKQEFGLQLSVTTNGASLNTDSILQNLVTIFDELTLSLDGSASQHDAWRGRPGLYASLESNIRKLAGIKARLGYGPRIRVNTILMRNTIQNFESLCLQLADWGVEEVTFNALGGRDRPEFFPDHRLLPADLAAFRHALPALRVRLASLGLTLLGSEHYLDRLTNLASNQLSPVSDCHPGATFWFIDEQGLIAPCSYTGAGYGIPLSEIQTLNDLDQLPYRFANRQRTQRLSICNDCPSTQVFGKFGTSGNPA